MKSNVAVIGSEDAPTVLNRPNQVVVDPRSILENTKPHIDDIEEDDNDRFITTRSGKPRPDFASDADQWAEDTITRLPPTLSGMGKVRVKRCGDGGGGGGANRSRRARRNRARRARANREGSVKSTKKVITRRIIQNGQVISETTDQGQTAVVQQPAQQTIVQSAQPQSVVYQPPVVQAVQQPNSAPVIMQSAAHVVQPAIQMPSISVQGSIKVNA